MKVRFLILLTLLSAILVLIGKLVISAHATNQPAQENAQRKIAPWVMEHTENGAEAEFLVILGDKADLSGMQRRVAATRFTNERQLHERWRNWRLAAHVRGAVMGRRHDLDHAQVYGNALDE